MNVRGAEIARFCADPARPALLLAGADAMRVALKRQDAVAAIVGPQGEAEMRVTRLTGADLRADPAALGDATRAQGFFPGRRAVVVEGAGDGLAEAFRAALDDWRPGDAQIVATAGALDRRSALRALFEGHRAAGLAVLYDDPPSREDIAAELARAGLSAVPPAALAELEALARVIEPGDFRQTLGKIALYKWGDPAPLAPEEVAALAPATWEAGVDEAVAAAAEGRAEALVALLRRLEGQGVAPVTLAIAAQRHFRLLHAAATDPSGNALARMRAPPRLREAAARQAARWGARRLETALSLLLDTDLALRSAARAPAMALLERALLRLAALAAAR